MGVFSTLKSLFKTSKKPVLKKASKSATPRKAAVAKTPKAAAKAKTPKKSPAAKKSASAKKAPASAKPKAKPKKKAAPESTYLEYVEPSKSKFWMITLDGKTTTVTFGKIAHGAAGTEQAPKAHESAAKARAFYAKQIAAKEKQGFTSLGLVPER